MSNILVTGFEAFGNYGANPTTDIANYFSGKEYNGNKVQTEILPVAFRDAPDKLAEKIEQYEPSLVISLGLSASGKDTRREDLNIEERAINMMNAKNADKSGYAPKNEKIEENGPEYRHVKSTGFDVENMVKYLKGKGIRARSSDDAAKYVCNDVMYEILGYIQEKGLDTKFSFVHMPWLEKYRGKDNGVDWDKIATMSEEEVIEAIEEMIKKAVAENKGRKISKISNNREQEEEEEEDEADEEADYAMAA